MMRTLPHSFVAGELATRMFGRPDDAKYAHGAARLRNLVVEPTGSVRKRPGTEFVAAAKVATRRARLIPFRLAGGQEVQLELGLRTEYPATSTIPSYVRIHRDGRTVLHSAPWSAATAYQVGDVASLAGVLYLCRQAHTNQSPPNATYWKSLEYQPQQAFAPGDVNTGTDRITFGSPHGFETNDPVDITNTGGLPVSYDGGSAIGTVALTIGYVIAISSTVLQISLTQGGPPLDLTLAGSGTHRIHRRYAEGELVSLAGSVYYCRQRRPIDGSNLSIAPNNGNEAYWYPQPAAALEIPGTLGLTEDELFAVTHAQDGELLALASSRAYLSEVVLLPAITGFGSEVAWQYPHWRWVQPSFQPTLAAPTGVVATATKRGATLAIASIAGVGPGSTRTAINTTTQHRLVAGLDFVQVEGSAMPSLHGLYFGVENGGNPSQFVLVNENGTYVTHTGVTTGGGSVRVVRLNAPSTNEYVVTAVDALGRTSQRSPVASVNNNLFVTGAYNTITWAAVGDAVRYRIFKRQLDTGLFGYIGESETTSFRDDNIAPDLGNVPPVLDTSLVSAPSNIAVAVNPQQTPRAVTYFEGRRCFAGSVRDPQEVWMTRTNAATDLSYSLPVKATDRIRQRLRSRVSCTIRHLLPLGQLIALSDTTEFRVSPINTDALTPDSFAARAQTYVGAAAAQPVVVDNIALFVGERGRHVYQMGFSSEAEAFLAYDLCERAPHLFDGYDIVQLAVQRSPVPIVWAVRSDGRLLGLTYVPTQQVFAWHWHDTDGAIESVAVSAEGREDRVYLIVRREVNGQTVRYVERMATMTPQAYADAWHADCALRYEGAATSTIGGLAHLEGKTVVVFADGLVQAPRVVAGGQVELDTPASKVLVGLEQVAELQTLPAVFAIEGYASGRPKNVGKVWLRIEESGRFTVGLAADDGYQPDGFVEAEQLTGMVDVRVPSAWVYDGQLFVRSAEPVPLRVTSITAEMEVAG
jgi:hypothetical protein